jgi:hypothetical protein
MMMETFIESLPAGGGAQLDLSISIRVRKTEQRAVQELPGRAAALRSGIPLSADHPEIVLLRPAVEHVPHDGVADRGQMDAELVPPSGLGVEAEKRPARRPLLDLPVRRAGLSVAGLLLEVDPRVPRIPDRQVDRAPLFPDLAGHQGEIFLVHQSGHEVL